jgi:hypothetical protein
LLARVSRVVLEPLQFFMYLVELLLIGRNLLANSGQLSLS